MSSRPFILSPTPASLGAQHRLRLDDYLPYRLSVAANAVSQLIARAYVDRFGLTVPQWRLMAVLGEDSPLTQQALCGRTVMDKVTVMRAARGLLQRRLLRRQPNSADGRSHRLSLTVTGERMYAEVAPLALKYEAMLVAGIEPLEVRRFEQWLRRLQQAAVALSDAGATR
ncbi:MAG TPA: MarR family winged helix-turn-helix transcriptional regulator [Steroidobacteraceae bacterium]|jgi:DNA-binding MarR family transcriptional regulator|nr:MarR family winged helix-turn-helix transcriptional regulator [Steroidobacteraceae bacterium]